MKRTLFLLLFYCCLTITVGKQVRSFCFQFLAEKNFTVKTLTLDFTQSETENEETDSEDTELNDGDNNDHELISQQVLCAAEPSSISNYHASPFFKDHLQEIGTPPPRS